MLILRRSRAARPSVRGRKAKLALGFGLGAALGLVVVGAFARDDGASSQLARHVNLERQPLGPSGERTTLAQALDAPPLPFLLPDDPLAANDSVRVVWTRYDGPSILIDYDSGVRLIESSAEGSEPKEYYSEAIADGVPGVLTEVSGLPAMLIEPQEGLDNPASVGFIVDDVLIQFIGLGGQSGEQLMRIASTMKM